MKKTHAISRRKFMGSASLLVLGSSLVSFKRREDIFPVAQTDKNRIWDEFSFEEKQQIELSDRAKFIVEIEGKSCAEKVLWCTLKSFKKSEKLVSFAASFGGGIKKGDLCGMLTGAFMSIGFAAGRLIKDEEKRAEWVKENTNEFWAWWLERAPRHCEDLRPLYANDDSAAHLANFNRMLQRVALKLDEMFENQA